MFAKYQHSPEPTMAVCQESQHKVTGKQAVDHAPLNSVQLDNQISEQRRILNLLEAIQISYWAKRVTTAPRKARYIKSAPSPAA